MIPRCCICGHRIWPWQPRGFLVLRRMELRWHRRHARAEL
jgi:hypothetical protein